MWRSRRAEPKAPAIPMAFDRGKAKYFHGRTQILKDFMNLIEMSDQEKSGTSFLVQGAPGAGKTALLAECARRVKEKGWRVVEIDTPDLCDPDKLRYSLGSEEMKLEDTKLRGGIPQVIEGEIRHRPIPETVEVLLQRCPGAVLLILDEAQTMGSDIAPDQTHKLFSVLKAIHNGKLGKSVFLLLAGLGRTKEVLNTLGISRFGKGAFVELSTLDKKSEHALLYDWLTKEGGARENPATWIQAIAQETHGWPQHILAYVDPALKQIRLDQGTMTPEGLNLVIEKGRIARAAYYEHRADGLHIEMRESLARPFRDLPPGGSLRHEQIMASLTQDFSPDQADSIFRRAEEKGIISSRAGLYTIPIPSMHNWLVSKYAIEPTKDAPAKSPAQGQEQSRERPVQEAERGTKQRGQTAPDSSSKDRVTPPAKSSPPAKSRKRDSGMDFGR